MFFLKRTRNPPDLVNDLKKEIDQRTQVTVTMKMRNIIRVQIGREVVSREVIPVNKLESARKIYLFPQFIFVRFAGCFVWVNCFENII